MESRDWGFSKRTAYKLIDVFEEFGNVHSSAQLGLTKLIQLTYIKDKEIRDGLTKEAPDLSVREIKAEGSKRTEDKLVKSIARASERENQDTLIVDNEDRPLKCKRIGNNIINDIEAILTPLSQIRIRILKWNDFAIKYPSDDDIQDTKRIMDTKWKDLKEGI